MSQMTKKSFAASLKKMLAQKSLKNKSNRYNRRLWSK